MGPTRVSVTFDTVALALVFMLFGPAYVIYPPYTYPLYVCLLDILNWWMSCVFAMQAIPDSV